MTQKMGVSNRTALVSAALVALVGSALGIQTAPISGGKDEFVKPNTAIQAQVESVCREIAGRFDLPGVWICVSEKGQVIGADAYGMTRLGSKPVSASLDQRVSFGSTSKALTGLLVSRLVSEGVLKWQTRFGDVIQDATLPNYDFFKNATVEQLMSHSAGLYGGPFEGDVMETDPQAARRHFVKIVMSYMPVARLGEKCSYAPGVELVGMMVEKLTGNSLENLMRSKIFDYYGVDSCQLDEPTPFASNPDLPFGYGGKTDARVLRRGDDPRVAPGFSYFTGGACYGTVTDLACMYSQIAQGKGPSRDFFQTGFAKPSKNTFFARNGFEVIGEQFFYHGGGTDRGQFAGYLDFKTGRSMAIFFNRCDAKIFGPSIDYARKIFFAK